MKYVTDGKGIEDILRKATMTLRTAYSKVDQIPIKEVIQALTVLPRVYNGKAHIFYLDGNSINIQYTNG